MKSCPVCEHSNKDVARKCEHCGSDFHVVPDNLVTFKKKIASLDPAMLQRLSGMAFFALMGLVFFVGLARRAADTQQATPEESVMGSPATSVMGADSAVGGDLMLNVVIWALMIVLLAAVVVAVKRVKRK